MYMHKPRGLNPGESYACSRTALRKCCEGLDLTVFWGERRSFAFDGMRNRPQIDGVVVASLTVKARRSEVHSVMDFYVINDSLYGEKQKALFEEGCLPHIREWLLSRKEGASAQLVIAWTGSSFRIHEIQAA